MIDAVNGQATCITNLFILMTPKEVQDAATKNKRKYLLDGLC